MQLLTDNFISKYPQFPDFMSPLGKFVYYRTYSRWLDNKKRRETWKETVRRAIEYNFQLVVKHYKKIGYPLPFQELKEEAEDVFDNVFNLLQAPSGRTLFVGGTKAAEMNPMANFNCSFINIETFEDIAELSHALMLGVGVGFKTTKELINKLPPIRNEFELKIIPYIPAPKEKRKDETTINISKESCYLTVGDSKGGWVESIRLFFHLLTNPKYKNIKKIEMNFNLVRPEGERLRTFGGRASGAKPLIELFEQMEKVLKNQIDPYLEPPELLENGFVKLRPIHVLDIVNLIGSVICVGGVRRTSEINLFDEDDFEILFSKYGINGLWKEEDFKAHEEIKEKMLKLNIPIPKWWDEIGKRFYDVYHPILEEVYTFESKEEAEEFALENNIEGYTATPYNHGRSLNHRRMSNNSILFNKKPKKDYFEFLFLMVKNVGEPGIINGEEARRRRPNFEGLNPCSEVLLDSRATCNLTTLNLIRFVKKRNGFYYLDKKNLMKAQKYSARIGVRMTLVDLELKGTNLKNGLSWKDIQHRDRLLGCSLTGFQDAMALLKFTKEEKIELLAQLRDVAIKEANKYCDHLRLNHSLLVCTVKPEGTLSQVFSSDETEDAAGGTPSSGLHWSHAPFYIRRIRINKTEPLVSVAKECNWTINPEVGQTWENARTVVIDFPVQSGAAKTKNDVHVEEQMENYFLFQKHYTSHNSSITVHCRKDEWEKVRDIIYDKFNDFVGVSFLSHDNNNYELAPYQTITETEYIELKNKMKDFDYTLLEKYEKEETDKDMENLDACESGSCPAF